MKNILYVILLSGLSLALFSCAKKSDTSSATTTTTELEGTWIASCYQSGSYYIVTTYSIAGTDLVKKVEYHSDSSCSTDYSMYEYTLGSLAMGDKATYSDGGRGYMFSHNVVSSKYTPQVEANVSGKNSSSWCGYSDWALNTAKDYTGITCSGTAYAVANTSVQGMYNLVGNNIFLGTLNTTGSYPTEVYTTITYVKQ